MVALMSQSVESIEAIQSQGTPILKTGSNNSPVCGDILCSEISNTQIQESKTVISGYTYKQDFIPVEKVEIDIETIAVFITDPQNDFLSEGGAVLQLRQYGVETIVLAGMSANLCVESHLRDAIENEFEVTVIADATAGAGPYSKDAALTNFEFISNEITTTDDIINRLKHAAQT